MRRFFYIYAMQNSFLNDVLQHLIFKGLNLSETVFVLPGKRAGSFLRHLLKTATDYKGFAPEILSIEEFITRITGLKPIDNTNSLFRFYEAYQKHTPKEEQEDFEVFYGWAQTLIYDFNEVDRYLINTRDFFGYLSNIKDIEHWSLADPQSEIVSDYLKFWSKLPQYHQDFTHTLLKNKEAYQGLIYRQASEQIAAYLTQTNHQFVFIGFNALNNAEQKIIQTVLSKKRGEIYWDIDAHFLKDTQHEAGLFIRQYINEKAFQNGQQQLLSKQFTKEKDIRIAGVPKNIGQAKYIGEILQQENTENTAVILNDEGLLTPVLNALPENIQEVNITMGLSLALTPPASLFEILFKIQMDTRDALYYKNVIDALSHPVIKLILQEKSAQIKEDIIRKNQVFISREKILTYCDKDVQKQILDLCFSKAKNKIQQFIEGLIALTVLLKPQHADKHRLETEYLFHFNKIFKKLLNLNQQYKVITSYKTLYRIYQEILQTESVDFNGAPFRGLQLMGMLETRTLDYDTVILTSVNEGILPSGKSANSFIPHELKKQYGLPTYREKDAVYTYHFYRLLQRAKKIYLLYNTEKSGLNAGEKSRFITQLEIEQQPAHRVKKYTISTPVPAIDTAPEIIEKTPEILDRLKEQAEKGFSPSALTSYIRNPVEFYKNFILGIKKDSEEVEETVALNTLGTVVHQTLETFYKPLLNKEITAEDINHMLRHTDDEITAQFLNVYSDIPLTHGKNLIISKVAKRFVHHFLKRELAAVEDRKAPVILYVESDKLSQSLHIPELDFPVNLKGTVDRVDQIGDYIRIIDYKTGKAEPKDLKLKDWHSLISDKQYNKAFQVLCYASLLMANTDYKNVKAGIISFKNLSEGFMEFSDKERKESTIDQETLHLFHGQLKKLIIEIFNPDIPFTEKEN